MAEEQSTSSVELAWAKIWQAVVIVRLNFMSSMTEALISRVFKSPVLWDHQTKDYHNRDFVDKEWRNHSQAMPLYFVYLLTYSMVQIPSWEAKWFAASQEIPRILWKQKVHYRTHKHPPPVPILCQPNPVHIPTSHLLEIIPVLVSFLEVDSWFQGI